MIQKTLFVTALLLFVSCTSTKKALLTNDSGWTKTRSGLQYKVLRQGSGEKPTARSRVAVHYEGQLMNGSVFESSYKKGRPATFRLNGVIRGWTEGLQLMKQGATYIFKIPPHLAYGSKGTSRIPGNSTLLFKVQLISVR